MGVSAEDVSEKNLQTVPDWGTHRERGTHRCPQKASAGLRGSVSGGNGGSTDVFYTDGEAAAQSKYRSSPHFIRITHYKQGVHNSLALK